MPCTNFNFNFPVKRPIIAKIIMYKENSVESNEMNEE